MAILKMKKVQNINELYFNYESCGLLIKEQCLSKSVTRMSYIRKRIRTNYYNEI